MHILLDLYLSIFLHYCKRYCLLYFKFQLFNTGMWEGGKVIKFCILTLCAEILNLCNSLMINLVCPELSVHATVLFIYTF